MRIRSEARVGIIVFAGIVALIVVYWFLGGLGLRASMYPVYAVFDNVQRLQKGAEVRMSGVDIGIVTKTTLTRRAKARVDMLIDNSARIPEDSVARITTGAFIGEYYVEIRPGRSARSVRAGARLASARTATPDELMEGANRVLQSLQGSARGINALLADQRLPIAVRDTVASLNRAAKSAAELLSTASALVRRVSPEVAGAVADTRRAARSAAAFSSDLQQTMRNDLRPKLNSVLAGANKLMQDLDASVEQARALMEGYKGGGPALEKTLAEAQKTLQTINDAAVQARQMLTNLNEASVSIKELATDEQLKADLKKTIHNVSEVSGQLKETVETIARRLGPAPGPSPEAKARVPEYGLTVNALADTGRRESRFDAYYTFIQGRDFYRIGGYNIGENTQLIAQGGSVFGAGGAFRYGLYASRIGVGYDHRLGGGLLSVDLFRPNDPQMELRATAQFSDRLGFYVGTNDLLHPDDRNLLIGVRYRK